MIRSFRSTFKFWVMNLWSTSVKVCYHLHGSLWGNFLSKLEGYQQLVGRSISLQEVEEWELWFQQNRAATHTTNSAMKTLQKLSGDHFISLHVWPLGSPDLSSPNYYPWAFSNGNVSKNNNRTFKEVKQNIGTCTEKITRATLRHVASNTQKRLDTCIKHRERWSYQHLLESW